MLLAALLMTTSAWAAGRIQWSKTRIEEDDGSWQVEVKIYLNRAPDIAHVPMRFSFKPVVYYERTLVDGQDGPITRKVPLSNQQPIVESIDIGFMDPGRGQIQKRTKFSFRITRGHGFEAGEYKVKVVNSRTGQTIGYEKRITLEGENEVVDRRSMVFKGKEEPDEDEDDSGLDMGEPEPKERKLTPEDDAFWAGGPTEDEDTDTPQTIKEKPGGCGCRTSPGSGPESALSLLAFALGAAALGRRRAAARRANERAI